VCGGGCDDGCARLRVAVVRIGGSVKERESGVWGLGVRALR
jgi:hypothetical protein